VLLCETAGTGRSDVEDLAIFVSQLAALGVPARIAVSSVPENPSRNLQFDLAPYLWDGKLGPQDGLALLAADQLTDETLARLRRLGEGAEMTVRAFGRFARPQIALGLRARLSYVFGKEPLLSDVTPADPSVRSPAPAFGVPRAAAPSRPDAPPRLLLVAPNLDEPLQVAALLALAAHRSFRVTVLTNSQNKQRWIAAHDRDVPFYDYSEASPFDLAGRTDVGVFFGSTSGSYRLQTLAANLLVSGTPVLDGSGSHRLAGENDAFIASPPGIFGLDGFLHAEILPNLGRIADHVRTSRAATQAAPQAVLDLLSAQADRSSPPRRRKPADPYGDIVFVPTNGVGLGHAQRCALIASALDRRLSRPVFAAFPSCMPLVKAQGFDVMPLVGRSALHAQSHEHDLVNYLRLRSLSAGARVLVFDGGYIFDSVYRTVLGGVRGVWIRRGLWQGTQDNSVALDREKAFDRVIVPSEAFEELNRPYSRGEHIHSVGPIVQGVALSSRSRDELRAALAERFARRFDRLAVSLLGGGVAADRGAQIQALCGLFERRSDTLHLVLVWPSATLESGWFGWGNSRVVRTERAAVLVAAADIVVTAAGYNSFHEVLYNRIPAIFVPQTGAFMDDQRARARAASERGLAETVEPNELLKLERLIARYLDEGEAEALRARLAAAELPEPGTSRAAQVIKELAHGPEAVERDPVADRAARRR
jgi:hypothetical protein